MARPRLGRRPAGLRWRLAIWVAAVVLLCTAVAFLAVYRGTGSDVRRQLDSELQSDARELDGTLEHSARGSFRQLAAAAAAYVHDQPFRASSTLLFVQTPRIGTITNRPELFRNGPPDNGESAVEQDGEDRLSVSLRRARDGFTTLLLADVGRLRLLKEKLHLPGLAASTTIGVGESLAEVTRAQEGVARAFILAGALALLAGLGGAALIGARVSRPLRGMASVAARVDGGDLHPRIHGVAGESAEVRVLADAFNHMLDRLTEAFAGQRAFVADASHELRTPLTVIRGQLEVLASQAAPSAAEVRQVEALVQAEIARISRLVDDLLLLARSEQGEFLRVQPIELASFVEELWAGMSLLAARRFELGPVPAGTLSADPDRVAQALRNLLANAIGHTAPGDGLVRLHVQTSGSRVRFVVEDDGPGIPADQRERVFHRFHRTDSARTRSSGGGTGLGLAIVRAIADAHGGWVRAVQSPEGGASLELELPGFTPAPRRPARASAPPLAGSAGGH